MALHSFFQPVTGPWASQENNAVELLDQSTCCTCIGFKMMNVFHFQRAFRYLQQAADAGNSNAMAYLGKVHVC